VKERASYFRKNPQLSYLTFETIGEKVGESLWPLFEMDRAALDEGSRTAVAMAVAETLNTATSALLARHALEPVEIARQLLADHPARSYHFSETEGRLYEQIVGESCQYIVDIASLLPRFPAFLTLFDLPHLSLPMCRGTSS